MGRIIVSSDRSGSGKTVITSGIMRALSKTFKVAPFKAGPDFIDPGYHRIATGVHSANLDLWLMGEEEVKRALVRYSKGYDVSVIEGVMGLYDGIGIRYSTYELSEVTKSPVVLLVNCSNVSTTAAAVVHGLKTFRNARIKGVIFNMVGSERHFSYCKEGLEGVKVLGYIPYSKDLKVPSRHLGLVTVEDLNQAERVIKTASELVESYVDLDGLKEIAGEAGELEVEGEEEAETRRPLGKAAIAYDQAFSFYYRDNLEVLGRYYELEFFSPLRGETVEGADFIYIGGGYPELHLSDLESSTRTKGWLKKSSEDGVPILAECGGLMYLSSELVDDRGYKMVGLFDIAIKAKDRLTIGYTELEALEDNLLSSRGTSVRGHEFHYSRPISVGDVKLVFRNKVGKGIVDGKDGASVYNTLATYSHFYFRTTTLSSRLPLEPLQ